MNHPPADQDPDRDPDRADWRQAVDQLHQLANTSGSLTEALGELLESVPALLGVTPDPRRDELVTRQQLAALRHTNATYTLWQRLLSAVLPDSSQWRLLLDALADGELPPVHLLEDSDHYCVALQGIHEAVEQQCQRLARPDNLALLAATVSETDCERLGLLCTLALEELSDTLPTRQLHTLVASHVREDHLGLWNQLTTESRAPWAAAAIAQWQAATRTLVAAGDELLRHLQRRADTEPDRPVTQFEAALLSELLDAPVTRHPSGGVSVDASADPWRDEHGRVVHPLGLDHPQPEA